jgi:hypothetical protein
MKCLLAIFVFFSGLSAVRAEVKSASSGFQWDFHWDKPWLGGTPRQIFPSLDEPEVEHWSSTEGQSDWTHSE